MTSTQNPEKPGEKFTRRDAVRLLGAGAAAAALGGRFAQAAMPAKRPNIVWILAEDLGPDLGCYGMPLVSTPNLDALAKEGIRFTNAFTASPVCSTSRSGMITGMHQASFDAHNHRSHRDDGAILPPPIRLVTDIFRDAGYFTANVNVVSDKVKASGKTDFNFKATKPFDGSRWDELKDKQPFFAQVNFSQPHRGGGWKGARARAKADGCLVDPDKVDLPPYYPDTPAVRDDWAEYLDAIHLMDANVGELLRQIDKDGLAENTIILFIGDHGRCHVRGKQWLYDTGIHISMLARMPGQSKGGVVREDLVSALDIVPTILQLAGIDPPDYLHGRVFLGPDAGPEPEYIFAARDRCDETVECIRCVRTKRYKYIRNYRPDLPYMQPNRYKDTSYPTRNIMRRLHAEGKLTPEQELWMAPRKPGEELYDIQNDPHEVHNLAESPSHQRVLERLRAAHVRWMDQVKDVGLIPEPELFVLAKKYGSGYVILRQKENADLIAEIRKTIDLCDRGKSATATLAERLKNKHPSVRWWAATGLGNLGADASPASEALTDALDDSSGSVRVAAARALGLMGKTDAARPVLVQELRDSENPIVRHYAALALEDLGADARPALDAIKAARKDSYGYVGRVTTRIVNTLGSGSES